jgi:hypothetical protein
MKRFAQIDAGIVAGIMWADRAPAVVPDGRTFVDITDRGDIRTLDHYDVETDTFTRPTPRVNRRLTHADVLSLLTPSEWAEMNKFQPQAIGLSASGTAYNDAQVFWGVGVFNKAAYIDLDDARFGSIIALFTSKGILTAERAALLQQQMAARAEAK